MELSPGLWDEFAQGGSGINESLCGDPCVYAELLASIFRTEPSFVE